jgi:hypothetical protein
VTLTAPASSPKTTKPMVGEHTESVISSDAGRDRMPFAAKVVGGTLFAASLLTAFGGSWLIVSGSSSGLAPAVFVASGFFFLAAAIVPLGMAREIRLEAEDKANCVADCRRLEEALALEGKPGLPETVKSLTLANFQQMRGFTGIAQRQARMSFYASLVGAGVSLLVLLAGAGVAIAAPSMEGKIIAGSLAVIGTALSTFLSKTFLRTYDMTLRQMSYYYGQPLVHCYLLHAELLTLMAPSECGATAKANMWWEVIRASIDASVNAQNHLLALHEHYTPGRRGGSFRRHSPTPHPVPPPMAGTVTDEAVFAAFRPY